MRIAPRRAAGSSRPTTSIVQSGPSSFVVGNARGWGTVALGSHTVYTQIYTESTTATYSYFQTDTRIYKP